MWICFGLCDFTLTHIKKIKWDISEQGLTVFAEATKHAGPLNPLRSIYSFLWGQFFQAKNAKQHSLLMCVDRKRSRRGVRPPRISAENSALITKAGFQTQSLLRSKCLLIKKKSQACKFWFVCTRCLGQSSRGAESITIGMRTWLLRRLRKSHRPMIKNSVQASLQAHHSGCPHKGTVNLFKKVEGGGLKKKKTAPSRMPIPTSRHESTFRAVGKEFCTLSWGGETWNKCKKKMY